MRRGWHGRRGRPPWWPENEPFPPQGGQWRPMRRRFMRRVLLFATGAMLVFLAVLAVAIAALLRAFELAGPRGGWLVALILAAGFAVVVFAGRGLRGFTAPLGDLIDAAGRIEGGDLSARVQERGPREVRSLARAFNAMSSRLETAEEQRRHLLADVSHELRTPLSVVQGNLEALLDGVYPPDEPHLRTILDETNVISRLVEDLRTLSLAEAGALALHREPTDLAALARETTGAFAPQAEQAGVSLETAASSELAAIEVDPVRVREVLTNLVANALRYTPRGGRVQVEAAPDDEGGVALSVTDTGAGIPPEALGRVFDRFYKSPESRGAGLGLAIAKQLVEAHGGTISASSDPGRGTHVRFTLPRERPSGADDGRS